MRHDGPKNIFAGAARKAFRDVEVEPELQPLEGEVMEMKMANCQDDTRSDVRVREFWNKQRNAFFEFRVPVREELEHPKPPTTVPED